MAAKTLESPSQFTSTEDLSGPQKAAILIMSMGAEAAAAIFRQLQDEEVERLTALITEVSEVPVAVRKLVLQEFREKLATGDGQEGFRLESMLSRVLGKEKAEEILDKASTYKSRHELFGFMAQVEPNQLAALMRTERPQLIALVLAHLKPSMAAEVLKSLSEDLQSEVVERIAKMDRVSPTVVQRVEAFLREQLVQAAHAKPTSVGGVKTIADILNLTDKDTEKRILKDLEERSESMVEDVRRLMLIFEDLSRLPDTGMQAILREVDMGQMALALKGASDGMKGLVFRNLSKRATERMQEEIELMGPKMRSEVNEAQQKVLAVARKLEDEGKLSLRKGGDSSNELIE
ncbi:MAG: flagellar motor switch protein FliG [Planctomycetota bacterium]